MFSEVGNPGVMEFTLAGIGVAATLALLPPGKTQISLMVIWALMPLWFVLWPIAIAILHADFVLGSLGFFVGFLPVILLPWLTLTLFSYHLTRKVRAKILGD